MKKKDIYVKKTSRLTALSEIRNQKKGERVVAATVTSPKKGALGEMRTRANKTLTSKKRAGGFDLQKWLGKTGIELHWPGYQYLGAGTHVKKRLKRGDPGINRLDKIAKQHNIDYSRAQTLQDKWQADTKIIKAIDKLAGSQTLTERIVKRIMQANKRLNL